MNGADGSRSACPPRSELDRLLANQLSPAEEQALEGHLEQCDACRRQLDWLTGFASSMQPSLPPADSAVLAQGTRRGSALVRLATAGGTGSRSAMLEAGNERPAADSKSKSSLASRTGNLSTRLSASGRFVRRQVWTWPLIAAALLSAAGWWVNRSVESALRQQRINELNTILDADLAALRVWMDKQSGAAAMLADEEQLLTLVRELLPLVQELAPLAEAMPLDRRQLVQAQAQAAIRTRLAEPLQRGKFIGFTLVSPAGLVLADDADAPIGLAASGYRGEFFQSVLREKQAAVSKPFLHPLPHPDARGELRANLPSMYAAAPIKDERDDAIAVLGLRIRPEDQFTGILRVARSGKTGETYAFDRSGVLLSESRFDDMLKEIGLLVDRPESQSILNIEVRDPGVNMVAGERPTLRRPDQPLTRMARAAIGGGRGFDVEGYNDYRGVSVVGAWQWLDEYDFGVTTEIDAAEAFAPVYTLRRAFAVLMGLLVAAAVAIMVAMLLIARQQRQLADAALAAQQFGQYTLVEKLGTGGMGTVYKARHALLRRPTAVKLLHPEAICDAVLARFEREVQLTSGLSHPNTVAIYDYGRTSGGTFYYAMEYLDGVNLDELVKKYGPLPEARAVYILRQVCASLAEAHAAGLVHRDVKPANILLTFRGGQHDFVKVLDFGLARHAGQRHDVSVTSTDIVAGTPLYVSPEAVTQPANIDARADVYAIGAVAYYLLTGSPVFVAPSAAEICLMHVTQTPEALSSRTQRPVSAALEALVLRCLAKAREDRPDDAAELLDLLETCPVSGRWTAADASYWWAMREETHSAATQAPVDPQLSAQSAVPG